MVMGDRKAVKARTERCGSLAFQSKPVRSSANSSQEAFMKEVRKVHYVKGVFVCPKCRQSYVQEKWIESWRVRCHRCDYRGALTDVSVEERMEEETFRR
jgi:hypothetical protein